MAETGKFYDEPTKIPCKYGEKKITQKPMIENDSGERKIRKS
jgi:hypothetical protein